MPENKQIILTKFVNEIKKILGKSLKRVILYGSYARGDFRPDSDIDLMVLTSLSERDIEKRETEIFDAAFDYQMDYGVDISVVVKNEAHFNYWLGALPFYDNVQREGVVLNG